MLRNFLWGALVLTGVLAPVWFALFMGMVKPPKTYYPVLVHQQ
jgi:hypothetical protein